MRLTNLREILYASGEELGDVRGVRGYLGVYAGHRVLDRRRVRRRGQKNSLHYKTFDPFAGEHSKTES